MIVRDIERYSVLLRLVGSLSGLFSDNDSPYVDSRFVERLYVETTGARDLGRKDISFDAAFGDIGIGVKTFLSGTGNSKREKVAEFTAYARDGRFVGLSKENLVREVVAARNSRVISDANEIGVDLSKSIYHCLIRVPGGAIVHEEPYGTIDENSLSPTTATGLIVESWDEMGSGIYFTDGLNNYSYSTAKNVLMKQFFFDREENFIPIEILSDPLSELAVRLGSNALETSSFSSSLTPSRSDEILARTDSSVVLFKSEVEELVPGIDFVCLPLYSVKKGEFVVPEKSGINQWNAGGRERKLGEAYVPIPKLIHRLFPYFFPARDEPFEMRIPNQTEMVSAKVCQDGSKALMTNPNFLLGSWLIGVMRPTIQSWQFEASPEGLEPITYEDLFKIQKDSVRITKYRIDGFEKFAVEFAPIGSYEDFISQFGE
jgi:hypothetical protein